MINGIIDRELEKFFQGKPSKIAVGIRNTLRRKLDFLAQAQSLEDLRSMPGNHLEKLQGDRQGLSSIRVNDQWRLCFLWTPIGVDDLELVDYH